MKNTRLLFGGHLLSGAHALIAAFLLKALAHPITAALLELVFQ